MKAQHTHETLARGGGFWEVGGLVVVPPQKGANTRDFGEAPFVPPFCLSFADRRRMLEDTHFELGFSVRLNCHDGKEGGGTVR